MGFSFKGAKFPEYCFACGKELTEDDAITNKIKSIMNSEKLKLAKKVELMNLKDEIKHDECGDIKKYCPYDGSELLPFGSLSIQGREYVDISCQNCNYKTKRPVTPKDELFLKLFF